MARALLVACGCRGRELGRRLEACGWQVRGTSRRDQGLAAIEAAGIQPALADPDRLGTVLDHVEDVTVVAWLLGSAAGTPAAVAPLHGARLERLLERLVDSPVRGFLYEGAGFADSRLLRQGAEVVKAARDRWRLPVAVVAHDPREWSGWVREAERMIGTLIESRAGREAGGADGSALA